MTDFTNFAVVRFKGSRSIEANTFVPPPLVGSAERVMEIEGQPTCSSMYIARFALSSMLVSVIATMLAPASEFYKVIPFSPDSLPLLLIVEFVTVNVVTFVPLVLIWPELLTVELARTALKTMER